MAMEHGLVEGVELGQGYAVRVRARNAAGWSPWSIESEQVIVIQVGQIFLKTPFIEST